MPARPDLRHSTPARRGVTTRMQPGRAGCGAGADVAALSDPGRPAEGSGNLDGPEVAASARPAPTVTVATAIPVSRSGRPRQRGRTGPTGASPPTSHVASFPPRARDGSYSQAATGT